MLIKYRMTTILCSITTSQLEINKSITMEMVGQVKISKHAVEAYSTNTFSVPIASCECPRVMLLLSLGGTPYEQPTPLVLSRWRLKLTSNLFPWGALRPEIAGTEWPDALGLALVSEVRVASTLFVKLSFIKLGLRGAFTTVWVSRLHVHVALSLPLKFKGFDVTIKLSSVRDIHMNFKDRLRTNRLLRSIVSEQLIMLWAWNKIWIRPK